MAKIFIFGGSGRVATDLIKDLVADGNTVTAAARHPENIIKLDGVTSDKLDLHADVEDISKQVKGFDAIYFTAGSRGKDLIQTDAMGAIETMMAAEKAGIKIGDVIIGADGKNITTMNELNEIKNSHNIGDTLEIKLNRNGKEMNVSVTLTEQP